MKNTVNSYFATLIIVIAGAAAVWTIIQVANSNTLTTIIIGSEASYAPLQDSILNQ
ncbi:MAG: hypothetical protein Q8O94_01015 [bacterium]|nr:hypothetical protein [bacterium]